MQWLKSTYNGNLQEYIDNSQKFMMALKTVNIHVPAKLHTFMLLGKLSGDPKIHQYVEVLSLNEDLVKKPKLVISKLQDFHNNSKTQHNPNCTSHSKEECFAKHPELRPLNRQNNKRKAGYNQNASAHISTAQALITRRASLLNSMEFIVDCGAMHHMFNSKSCFSTLEQTPHLEVCTRDSTSSLLSEGIGTVVLLCNNKIFTLNDCLFVPKLNCNLISLLGICKEKLIITQDNGNFKLELNHQALIEGKIINNLMRVEFSIPKALSTQATKTFGIKG
ncbi:hypothetical protein O181_088049 [Austropuccinia psidii MF-1]|uniref:Retrovirus-related Pol polyprotein from transposon TNT 1-94-like beta-barrel domain-containing protein n=1 Tax=Austropuccinia psidii MF-1 TaxID=1389203 RepID=A0A9Q3IQX8_9BASI|nr:hypothetical protein [Austropuccinia psidii MF-1]